MPSKTVVITGASDGIGAAAARQLKANGQQVVITGRSAAKTSALARELQVDHFIADFSKLAEVRQLAIDLNSRYDRIDVLANNAGAVFNRRQLTSDGFEQTFQVNHLATFLLTVLQLDKLIASGATVIQTSSMGARTFGHLNPDDLNSERNYAPMRAYGTSKLQNILFTRELHRRYHLQGVNAAAFHPGVVASNFGSTTGGMLKRVYASQLARRFMVTVEDGASQLVWLADTEPGVAWQPGEYFEKGQPARRVNPQVRDDDLAIRLWDDSLKLLDAFL